MKFYWHTLRRPFYVTYHLFSDFTARWRGIYGVQIGSWFIGVVRGAVTGSAQAGKGE